MNGSPKTELFELFELKDFVVAKKSPDIEQKKHPRREQPRSPGDVNRVRNNCAASKPLRCTPAQWVRLF